METPSRKTPQAVIPPIIGAFTTTPDTFSKKIKEMSKGSAAKIKLILITNSNSY